MAFRFVGEDAVLAVLDFLCVARIRKIPAAFFAPTIERTIAKQAVEPFGIAVFMARKIPAPGVSEKFVTVVHPVISQRVPPQNPC